MRLVSFSGHAGSGKTTAAQHAIACFTGTKLSLADAVKEEVSEYLVSMGVDFERRHLWGSQADREERLIMYRKDFEASLFDLRHILYPKMLFSGDLASVTYRELLQLWGTEYRRKQKESYWCDKGREKVRTTEGLAYFDDIRFPDEVEMIKAEGGIVIRLERPGDARISNHLHPSETALDDYKGFTWTIYNGGSLEEFKSEVQRIVGYCL